MTTSPGSCHPAGLLAELAAGVELPVAAALGDEVWGVDTHGRSAEEAALAGVDALAAFIAEVGLPTTLTAMGIDATDELLRDVARTSIRTPACAAKLTDDDIFELLAEYR